MGKVLLIAGAISLAALGVACSGDGVDAPGAQMPGGMSSPGMSPIMDEYMDHGSTSESVDVPQGAQRSIVRAVEFAFKPNVLAAKAGRPVAITFVNEGTTGHDYTVHDARGAQIEGGHAYAEAGERATLVVTLAPSTYEVWCTIAGHRQAGMTATIVAT